MLYDGVQICTIILYKYSGNHNKEGNKKQTADTMLNPALYMDFEMNVKTCEGMSSEDNLTLLELCLSGYMALKLY